VAIRVSNSGSTISPDRAERVFDRFWRGDTARSRTGYHHGLGLSLVKKAVKALGGSIGVVATEGGDFEITISLPGDKHLEGRISTERDG